MSLERKELVEELLKKFKCSKCQQALKIQHGSSHGCEYCDSPDHIHCTNESCDYESFVYFTIEDEEDLKEALK